MEIQYSQLAAVLQLPDVVTVLCCCCTLGEPKWSDCFFYNGSFMCVCNSDLASGGEDKKCPLSDQHRHHDEDIV